MQTVQLVTGVKITEVPLLGRDEVPYYSKPENTRCVYEREGTEKFLAVDAVQDTQYARVMYFKESDKPDIYIAWSEKVEQAIGVPLRAILKEKDELASSEYKLRNDYIKLNKGYKAICAKYDSFKNMSFWQRLKWAFKGE